LTLAAAAGGWLWWRFSVPAMEDEITPFNAYARSIQPEGDDGWPRYERFLRDRLGFDVLAARPWDAEAVQPFRAAQRQFGNLMAGELDDPRLAESLAAVREYGF